MLFACMHLTSDGVYIFLIDSEPKPAFNTEGNVKVKVKVKDPPNRLDGDCVDTEKLKFAQRNLETVLVLIQLCLRQCSVLFSSVPFSSQHCSGQPQAA